MASPPIDRGTDRRSIGRRTSHATSASYRRTRDWPELGARGDWSVEHAGGIGNRISFPAAHGPNLHDLDTAVVTAQSQLDEFKNLSQWALAGLGVLIAFGGAAGGFYVKHVADEAAKTASKRAKKGIKNAEQNALNQIEALRSEVQKSLQLNQSDIDYAIAQQRYSIASVWWENKNYSTAIDYARNALKRAQASIEVLQELKERTQQQNDELTSRLRYKCYIEADLAYYYVERFVENRAPEDSTEALMLAKSVFAGWTVFGAEPPLALIDTYLFVVASSGIAGAVDKEQGLKLLKDYEGALEGFLEGEREDFKMKFNVYRSFFIGEPKAPEAKI